MSRRGRVGTPITLFSFQDIITSVSGVIIVMVLLLALELIQRPTLSPATPRNDAGKTIEEIRSAEEELRQLKQKLESNQQLSKDLATSTPASLHGDISALRSAQRNLEAEMLDLKLQQDRLTATLQVAKAEHDKAMPVIAARDALRKEVEELAARSEAERRENRTVFSLPRGTDKDGWIVVVSSGQLVAAPIGRAEPPTIFAAKRGIIGRSSPSDAFLEWLTKSANGRNYCLLLVRPSGIEEFETLRDHLKQKSFDFGFDLVGEGQSILHPERGATF